MDSGLKVAASFNLAGWMAQHLKSIERALERWVTADATGGVDHGAPVALVDAMRYAVLDGGKRLRPLLVMAGWEAAAHGQAQSTSFEAALRAACAVELIHA